MDKLKELQEKRAALIKEMEKANEERAFDVFETKNKELDALDQEIAAEKRMLDLKMVAVTKTDDIITVATEIREAISNSTELTLDELEFRAETMGVTTDNNVAVGNIKKVTFADYILQKLPYISPLYGATRKEVLGSAMHSVPVQKNKIGKFVRMAELQKYAQQNADYNTIKLEPNKYGTLISFSEEVLEDLGYDIEADLMQQLLEAYGLTLDELIVNGDITNKVDGLNSFSAADGCHEVTQKTSGTITADELLDIYYSLPIQYRNTATWVLSDDTARELSKLTFKEGQPVLFESYNGSPVGPTTTILGKPVIINNNVAKLSESGVPIFFGDLTKAIIVAPRKSFTIKRSDEFGFIDDSIAVKANARLDIKKAMGEAMSLYKSATGRSAKK